MNNLLHSLIVPLLAIFVLCELHSQQATPLYDGNYSGIHGVIKNPAYGPHGMLEWDINLASANIFLDNDYGFVRKTNLFHLLNNANNVELVDLESNQPPPRGTLILDFDDGNDNKYFEGIADVQGPSAFMRNERWSYGIFTRLRAEAGTPDLPGEMGYYNFQTTPINTLIDVPKIQGAALTWGEIGLNASRSFLNDRSLSIGLSFKYLIGYEAIYSYTNSRFSLIRQDEDNLAINSTQITMALTSGIRNHNDFSISQKGRGFGFDLGMSKIIDRYRLGVAILDIGKISFSTNSEIHQLNIQNSLTFNIPEITAENNLDGLLNETNELIADTTLMGTNFSIALPTRIRLTLDYKINKTWFVHAGLIQRLTGADNAIRRANHIAITPRYETRWVTVSTPVTISNYKSLKFGLGARLGFITLGTDDLFSLVGKSNFNGASFYLAVKLNPFNTNVGSSGRKLGCPEFTP